MLIDWFTVFAQIVNLLILVWLLKRFLYKPILNAVAQREKAVHDQIELAESKIAESESLKAEYVHKNETFDKDRETRLNQVAEESEQLKMELTKDAKQAYEALSLKQKETLHEEENQMQQDIILKTQAEVYKIAKKALKDLSNQDLEKQMIAVFIQRLTALGSEERLILKNSVNVAEKAILIKSTFDVEAGQRNELADVINEIIGETLDVSFEMKPELISGVELVTDGYRLSWNLEEYLSHLSKKTTLLAQNKNLAH